MLNKPSGGGSDILSPQRAQDIRPPLQWTTDILSDLPMALFPKVYEGKTYSPDK